MDEEEDDDEEENEGSLQQPNEVPSGELALLLAQSDILHTGDASLKAEGFRLLLDNRAEVSRRRLSDGPFVTAQFHKFTACLHEGGSA